MRRLNSDVAKATFEELTSLIANELISMRRRETFSPLAAMQNAFLAFVRRRLENKESPPVRKIASFEMKKGEQSYRNWISDEGEKTSEGANETDVLQYYVNSAWLKIKFSPFSWRTKQRRKPVDGGEISSFVGQNFRRITKVFSFPFSALLYRDRGESVA